MANLLVTGASGFLGKAFVDRMVKTGQLVYALYRNPPERQPSIVAVQGDILKDNLGITVDNLPRFDRVYHIAGTVKLGSDRDGLIYKTNAEGTRNVVKFCEEHQVEHIFYCSTAYTLNRNPYECSKKFAEWSVLDSSIPKKTIFKPSIILGTKEHPYYGHFSQFAGLVIRVHRRAEKIRRGVEDMMMLPPIRPLFRVEGNKDGNLNLIKLDDVVEKMVSFTEEGTCWLTNPNPPKLGYLLKLIGEEAMVNAVFEKGFNPSVVESQFARMMKAFQPYLEGDDMPSNIEKCELSEEYLRWTINNQMERG